MKALIITFFAATSFNVYATIDGLSCEDLNKTQEQLLLNASKSYIAKKYRAMNPTSITSSDTDCHDYDGVHNSSEFTVEWTQTDEDQKMHCSQDLGVSVDYHFVKKEKFINKNSRFIVEERNRVKCVN